MTYWAILGATCAAIVFVLGMVVANINTEADFVLARDVIHELMLCNDTLALRDELVRVCLDTAMSQADELEACRSGSAIRYTY